MDASGISSGVAGRCMLGVCCTRSLLVASGIEVLHLAWSVHAGSHWVSNSITECYQLLGYGEDGSVAEYQVSSIRYTISLVGQRGDHTVLPPRGDDARYTSTLGQRGDHTVLPPRVAAARYNSSLGCYKDHGVLLPI